jgi:hypothetical protein
VHIHRFMMMHTVELGYGHGGRISAQDRTQSGPPLCERDGPNILFWVFGASDVHRRALRHVRPIIYRANK